ncbi:MAG: guanylate kinase, partial [Lachnospiraceae bacterium]|nr:guanylate kinase [Lachnospiraceae bacterium]
ELDDGLRLERALNRERQQKVPGYAEMCRRFLADSEDFSEENLQKAGIKKRFENTDLDTCIEAIKQEIREMSALS